MGKSSQFEWVSCDLNLWHFTTLVLVKPPIYGMAPCPGFTRIREEFERASDICFLDLLCGLCWSRKIGDLGVMLDISNCDGVGPTYGKESAGVI